MGFKIDETGFPLVRCTLEGSLNDVEMKAW